MSRPLRSWLLVALALCSGGLACTEKGSGAAVAPAVCDVQVTGESIQYKGSALPLPGPLEAWEKVLGPHSRRVEVADTTYVWDQAGIYAYLREPETELRGFSVLLTRQSAPDEEVPAYWPRSSFQGRLCVDGSSVSASTRMEEINQAKQGQKFSRGYLDSIYHYYITSPRVIYVRIDLADSGRPESFSMDLSDGAPR